MSMELQVGLWDAAAGPHSQEAPISSTAAETPPHCEGDREESTADIYIFLLQHFMSFLRHCD